MQEGLCHARLSFVILDVMEPVLGSVRAWHLSNEVGTRPAETLSSIVNILKLDRPMIDVFLTVSSSAHSQHVGHQTWNLSDVPANVDVVAFEHLYCYPGAKPPGGGQAACSLRWSAVEIELERLAAFAAQHTHMRVAVIPDATLATNRGIGALSQRELVHRYLGWCAHQSRCVALFPFVDAHWADVKQEGEVYPELEQIGDAVRTGDWANTSLGAAMRLRCPLVGVLTHVPCADHGCDGALLPLDGVTVSKTWPDGFNASFFFLDYCNASPPGHPSQIDFSWSCCANHTNHTTLDWSGL